MRAREVFLNYTDEALACVRGLPLPHRTASMMSAARGACTVMAQAHPACENSI